MTPTPRQLIDFTLRLDVSDSEVLELLRGRKSRIAHSDSLSKASLSARFKSDLNTIVLRGMLHNRYPVNFQLKPQSKSHTNFLRLLVRELREAKRSIHCMADVDSLKSVDQLRDHLEKLLEAQVVSDSDAQAEVVDLYRADFELLTRVGGELELPPINSKDMPGLQVLDQETGERLFTAKISERAKTFRFFGENKPLLISGFVDNEPQVEFSLNFLRPLFDDWRSVVMFHPGVAVETAPGDILLRGQVAIPQRLRSSIELFAHWGPKSQKAWRDEEISPLELKEESGEWLSFEKHLRPEQLGDHGVSLCAQVIGTNQRLWLADLGIADLEFGVTAETLYCSTKRVRERRASEADIRAKLLRATGSYDRFVKTIDKVLRLRRERRITALLHETLGEDVELRALVDSFYKRLNSELLKGNSKHSSLTLKRVKQVLNGIGIGEVVFVTPEGPHAIAGGLAQVIVGLSKALSHKGVPTTIIAPIYEQAQGSKHLSAQELLDQGVVLADQRVPLERCGEIKICFGATRIAGTMREQQFARVVPVQVYKAERGNIRLFLLRHHTLADALYSYASGEDSLRKAVFLARGALELLRSREFDIVPDTIISNDWLSALVPVYLKCDSRYREFGGLDQVKTVHMLHNAGSAFQGKFFVNEYSEDLWPILNLEDRHFFWLSDPDSSDHLNLSAGAIRHISGAVLTVSQPYAEELLKPECGGSLSKVLEQRKDKLFGISNGVDTDALRLTYRELGEESCLRNNLPPIFRAKNVSAQSVLRQLPLIKSRLKKDCQQSFNLDVRPDSLLLSLVGRLTSQKGIQLLTAQLSRGKKTVLESLVEKYPNVQLLVAGPISLEDAQAKEFYERYQELMLRYPGRIAASFDFLPHRQALSITCASDLFLMPSLYEPGGITQLEALSAGTSVVGHNVGGIAATLSAYNDSSGGDSFLFNVFSATEFYKSLQRAIACLTSSSELGIVRGSALAAKHDWTDRVSKYMALLHSTSGVFDSGSDTYSYLSNELNLLAEIRPRS